jgi:hypothetical protein
MRFPWPMRSRRRHRYRWFRRGVRRNRPLSDPQQCSSSSLCS